MWCPVMYSLTKREQQSRRALDKPWEAARRLVKARLSDTLGGPGADGVGGVCVYVLQISERVLSAGHGLISGHG